MRPEARKHVTRSVPGSAGKVSAACARVRGAMAGSISPTSWRGGGAAKAGRLSAPDPPLPCLSGERRRLDYRQSRPGRGGRARCRPHRPCRHQCLRGPFSRTTWWFSIVLKRARSRARCEAWLIGLPNLDDGETDERAVPLAAFQPDGHRVEVLDLRDDISSEWIIGGSCSRCGCMCRQLSSSCPPRPRRTHRRGCLHATRRHHRDPTRAAPPRAAASAGWSTRWWAMHPRRRCGQRR